MKPIAIDAIQMTQDRLPPGAATAPRENSTKGGTPLATQKAPVQSMPRSRPAVLTAVSTVATSAVELMVIPLEHSLTGSYQCASGRIQRGRGDPVRECLD